MAVLVVDDIVDPQDIVNLVTYLTGALARGEADGFCSQGTVTLTRGNVPSADQLADAVRLGQEESCENPLHRPMCSCIEDAANRDPRQLILVDAPRHEGAVPYVVCGDAGTHARLTDCWMCWSDVNRGAITVDQVLASARAS